MNNQKAKLEIIEIGSGVNIEEEINAIISSKVSPPVFTNKMRIQQKPPQPPKPADKADEIIRYLVENHNSSDKKISLTDLMTKWGITSMSHAVRGINAKLKISNEWIMMKAKHQAETYYWLQKYSDQG